MFNNMTYEEVYDKYIQPQKILAFEEGYEKGYERGKKDGHIQALDDIKKYILNSCNNVTCRENINADNDFDFYASELLDMLEEIKK